VVGVKLKVDVEVGNNLLVLAEIIISIAAEVVGFGTVGIKLDSSVGSFNNLRGFFEIEVGIAQAEIGMNVIRVKLEDTFSQFDGIFPLSFSKCLIKLGLQFGDFSGWVSHKIKEFEIG
jgi:hypothetical protein